MWFKYRRCEIWIIRVKYDRGLVKLMKMIYKWKCNRIGYWDKLEWGKCVIEFINVSFGKLIGDVI